LTRYCNEKKYYCQSITFTFSVPFIPLSPTVLVPEQPGLFKKKKEKGMAMSNSNSIFSYTTNQIPVFNGEHYDYWNSQMETIFISQDLWDVVEDGYEECPIRRNASSIAEKENEYKENVKKNATSLRIIQQGVSKAIYPRIFGVKKAKDAWDILKTEFQGSSKVISIKLQSLWGQFENLAMKEGEKVKDFFSRVTEIGNQIKSCGEEVPEKKVVEKILRSLPQKI